MDKEFVPYTEALALKELGFDEPCIYYVDKENEGYIYNFQCHPDEFIEWCACDVIKTPLWQQAFKWFREEYNIYVKINLHDPDRVDSWRFTLDYIGGEIVYIHKSSPDTYFKTYEEAELECIRKLIEIVKDEEK